MSETNIIAFKAITTFTNQLADEFTDRKSSKHRSLRLYCRLVNKTTFVSTDPINKHVEAFKLFCVTNRESLCSKELEDIKTETIYYSKAVYINIKQLLNEADNHTRNVIWDHLLVISALVDPEGKAKEMLKNVKKEMNKDTGNEANFLADIISKVESSVNVENDNPAEAFSSIMNSGIFTELIGGMNTGLSDGSLDIGKLMGTVQNMVSTISNGDEGEAINTMMGSMGQTQNQDGPTTDGPTTDGPPPFDIGSIMGMMGPLMGAMGGGGDGSTPDIASMMGPLMGAMGAMGGGNAPDIASMMGAMGGGNASDIANMMGNTSQSSAASIEEVDNL
jgi:hypothetical protein